MATLLIQFASPTTVAATLDLEGLPDGQALSNQFVGAILNNAVILTAGISLNEFEFPPHSGLNVATDNGAPIAIAFSNPIIQFSGYFTYLEPLTISAFDAADILVASTTSAFLNNLALSGDAGSAPNELLSLAYAPGFARVLIEGNPAGGSFVVDDISYTPRETSEVPEPAMSLPLVALACAVIMRATSRSR